MSVSAEHRIGGEREVRRRLNARRSPALRPAVEPVERRTLLATTQQPLVIAALGDSLTDEYAFYGAATPSSVPAPTAGATTLPPQIYLTGRDAARNWDMAIGALIPTQLTFGPYVTSSRGATRNEGFLENWALSGTTASGPDIGGSGTTFAEEYEGIPAEFSGGINPTPGLVTQTSSNGIPIQNVNVVTILIGGNDYVAALSTLQPQSITASDIDVFSQANQNIEAGISSAVQAIEAASPNTKIVIATTPDVSVAPLLQDIAGSNYGVLKEIIGSSIDALNTKLALTYKSDPNVGLINTKSLISQFISDPVIDGVTVNMEGAGQDYTDGFTGDGFHPGTIVQGLLAQAVVAEINTLYGSQVVTPISDAQIVNYAETSQPTIHFSVSTTNAVAGQGVTLSAQVVQAVASNPIPTGTVTFETLNSGAEESPGLILGSVPLSASGTASLPVSSLPAGSYQIAAIYNGDQTNDARLSDPITLAINNTQAPTGISLYSSVNPATSGQPVKFTAIVTTSSTGLPVPSGSVSFIDQATGQPIGSALLDGQGVATLTVSNLTPGSHSIVASYGGRTLLAGSTSAPLTETVGVSHTDATTTQVIPTYAIVRRRALVTVQVVVSTVEPGAGVPTGSVQLIVGPSRPRTLVLDQGQASITLPLRLAARRTVVAHYTGDAEFAGSGSPFVTIDAHPFRVSKTTAR